MTLQLLNKLRKNSVLDSMRASHLAAIFPQPNKDTDLLVRFILGVSIGHG